MESTCGGPTTQDFMVSSGGRKNSPGHPRMMGSDFNQVEIDGNKQNLHKRSFQAENQTP